MVGYTPPDIATPPPASQYRLLNKPTFKPGLIDHSKAIVAGLPFFRSSKPSPSTSSTNLTSHSSGTKLPAPSSSQASLTARNGLTSEAIQLRNTAYRGWIAKSSKRPMSRSQSVPSFSTSLSPLCHPVLTDPGKRTIPSIRHMYDTIERLTTLTEIRNKLNEYIKKILHQLLGPPPTNTGFQCPTDGHRYSGIMLITGVSKGLMDNIGYYAYRCILPGGIHITPITLPMSTRDIKACQPLWWCLQRRHAYMNPAPTASVQHTPSSSQTSVRDDNAGYSPSPLPSNSARSSRSSRSGGSSSSQSLTAISSVSSSARTAISSYSALSPTHGQFASPPSIPASAQITDFSSDDDAILNFKFSASRSTKDSGKGKASTKAQDNTTSKVASTSSKAASISSKVASTSSKSRGKKCQRVIDLTSDAEIIDLTSDAEPSSKRQKVIAPTLIIIHFHKESNVVPTEVELVPRPDGTLCLTDSVNRTDLRRAGIDMIGAISLMDDSDGPLARPSWVPVTWDEPFVHSVTGPTILKRIGVETFYDFQKN